MVAANAIPTANTDTPMLEPAQISEFMIMFPTLHATNEIPAIPQNTEQYHKKRCKRR